LIHLARAGVSLTLIAFWVVFLLVPSPDVETAEIAEPVGLFTRAIEVAEATACPVLWFRARDTDQPDRTKT
jgi:hypothetical protein